MKMLNNVLNNERGQGMVEYALIIALVGVFLVAALTGMRNQIIAIFQMVTTRLAQVAGG